MKARKKEMNDKKVLKGTPVHYEETIGKSGMHKVKFKDTSDMNYKSKHASGKDHSKSQGSKAAGENQ